MNEIFKNQELKLMQVVARGAENIFEDEAGSGSDRERWARERSEGL